MIGTALLEQPPPGFFTFLFLDSMFPFLVPSGLILEEETLINLTSWQELEHPVLV